MGDLLKSLREIGAADALDRGSRWLVAAVFLFAGVPKILDPLLFAKTIGAYELLPEFLLLPAAVLLPFAELVAAVLLIRRRKEGLWLTAGLMVCFIAVLSYGILLGLDIDCGCFGPEDPEHVAFSGLRTALIRDMLLCIPLLYGFWYHFKNTSQLHGDRQ